MKYQVLIHDNKINCTIQRYLVGARKFRIVLSVVCQYPCCIKDLKLSKSKLSKM